MKEEINQAQAYIARSSFRLFDNIPCGFLLTLSNGLILKINQTMLDWLGYRAEEVVQKKRFQDFLTMGGKIFYEAHHMPTNQVQGYANELNYDLQNHNRQKIPVLVNSRVEILDDEKTYLNQLIVFNITDRKKYERELLGARKKAEALTEAKSLFLSTISHEIRTPLHGILGTSDLLLKSDPQPEQLELINVLRFSANNLLALIDQILNFSKIESDRFELVERDFNFFELVRNIYRMLRPKATEKGIALSLKLTEGLPEFLKGDPIRISQVLINLLSNAIKFTEEGEVTLAVKVKETQHNKVTLNFAVSDTGIGISADQADHIFEFFTQADSSIHNQFGGTGLGLAISQGLLAKYHSKLMVTSELGVGSTFAFDLMLDQGTPVYTSEEAGTKAAQVHSVAGMKVLLVDDNPANVFIASKYLQRWKVDFAVAENGQIALDLAINNRYDVVLMDLKMPVMDGYTAARAIRKLPDIHHQQLPIIALSASVSTSINERMKASFINDFLLKPFRAENLLYLLYFYGNKKHLEAPLVQGDKELPAVVSSDHMPQKNQQLKLDKIYEIFDHDQDAIRGFLEIMLRDLSNIRVDLAEAMTQGDSQRYREVAHKMKMVLRLLDADQLIADLQQGKTQLTQTNEPLSEAFVQRIDLQLQQITDLATQELEKWTKK